MDYIICMEIKNVLDYLNLSYLILSVRERGPKVNKNYSVHVAWVDHGMEGGGKKCAVGTVKHIL